MKLGLNMNENDRIGAISVWQVGDYVLVPRACGRQLPSSLLALVTVDYCSAFFAVVEV